MVVAEVAHRLLEQPGRKCSSGEMNHQPPFLMRNKTDGGSSLTTWSNPDTRVSQPPRRNGNQPPKPSAGCVNIGPFKEALDVHTDIVSP